MRTTMKSLDQRSGVAALLDDVRLTERDREIAKAYARKTEAVLDVIWLAGATIRAGFAPRQAQGGRAGAVATNRKQS